MSTAAWLSSDATGLSIPAASRHDNTLCNRSGSDLTAVCHHKLRKTGNVVGQFGIASTLRIRHRQLRSERREASP